jgi:hypothetical protein
VSSLIEVGAADAQCLDLGIDCCHVCFDRTGHGPVDEPATHRIMAFEMSSPDFSADRLEDGDGSWMFRREAV